MNEPQKSISPLSPGEIAASGRCSAPRCEGTPMYLVKYPKCISCGPNKGVKTVHRLFCSRHTERYARLNNLPTPGIVGEELASQVGGAS